MTDGCVGLVPTETGEVCQRCGRSYSIVWYAPDAMWFTISGHSQGNGLLCPDCFDELAQGRGIFLRWECKELD